MSHPTSTVVLHLTRSSAITSWPARLVLAESNLRFTSVIRQTGPCSAGRRTKYLTPRAARLDGCRAKLRALSTRASAAVNLTGPRAEHFLVPCASAGAIVVSLYNVREHPPTTPLLLYLPPSSADPLENAPNNEMSIRLAAERQKSSLPLPDRVLHSLRPPPDYLLRQNFPIAVIHYRWTPGREVESIKGALKRQDQNESQDQEVQPAHLWPRPLHDVMFAYDWIKKHLSPTLSDSTRSVDGKRHFLRRDLYVHGAYLGATLATSLALTETHPSQRVAIRGVVAHNGIYNWTAFVGLNDDSIPIVVGTETVQKTTPGIQALTSLFCHPSGLFDEFASPCLFFRTTGHLIAPLDLDPDVSQRLLEESEARLVEEEERENRKSNQAFGMRTFATEALGTTRKVYLGFPPARSTLRIPSALLLHTGVPPDLSARRPREKKQCANSLPRQKIPESCDGNNSFAVQAEEMTALMRRSIDKVELKRLKDQQPALIPENDSHTPDKKAASRWSNEAEHRVRIAGVDGPPNDSLELGIDGQQKLLAWLKEHMLSQE